MNQANDRNGQFVVPGEKLCIIEEFIPGSGTYVEEGTIYSEVTGRVLLDFLNKEVSVYPLVTIAKVPQLGSIVEGQVMSVQNSRATLRITKIGEDTLTGFFTGVLHVSSVSPHYIETMFEACRAGDFMRAKVVSDKNKTSHLSTIENTCGVLYAFCSHCGYLLTSEKQIMLCLQCGKKEKRKVATDYVSQKE